MKNDVPICPLLSIVIANYNFGQFLKEAISSVLDQECPDVELIVVDGGSADNSVEVIKRFSSQLAWWCSEKDSGQSEAFNKGFRHARGKYLTWLNADDVMPTGSLSRIVSELRRHPTCEWFTGNHLRFLESDKTIIQVEWGPNYYPKILQKKNSPLVIFGPSTFFTKYAYERVGRIDETLHLAMDTDLWLRFQAAGIKQRRINCYCWAFRMHEKSKTAEYEGHKHVSHGSGAKLAMEHLKAASKVSYRPSAIIRCLMMVFRIFDGSFAKRFFERKRLLGANITSHMVAVCN